MKNVEKAVLAVGGVAATYLLARTVKNILESQGTQEQGEGNAPKPETSSEVYQARLVGNTTKAGIGRQLVPRCVSHDEWHAAGSPVRDEPYDVHVTSVYGAGPQGERNYWAVTDMTAEDPGMARFELDILPTESLVSDDTYVSLASRIDQQIGRTGLTIIVS